MTEQESRMYLIPRRLDAPPKFLLWDFDVIASCFVGIGIGIIVSSLTVGAVFASLFVWSWSRIKAGRHPAYGFHFLYWHLPFKTFKRTPISARRHFVG